MLANLGTKFKIACFETADTVKVIPPTGLNVLLVTKNSSSYFDELKNSILVLKELGKNE